MNGHTSESVTIRMRFVTPAFLGGADQSAELRAAPFKALLRQCWRLASAKKFDYDHHKLREAEGCLFGHTWLESYDAERSIRGKPWHMKSTVRLTLEVEKIRHTKQAPIAGEVSHPEVGERGRKVNGAYYLGYGPLEWSNGQVRIKKPPALDADSQCALCLYGQGVLHLRETLQPILSLFHWIGCLGGRSRNGWGSITIDHVADEAFEPSDPVSDLADLTVPLEECLKRDWAVGFGRDEKGMLFWRAKESFDSWAHAITSLAEVKIALRTSDILTFKRNRDAQDPRVDLRHILAYPVTNHGVLEWSQRDKDGRPVLTRPKRPGQRPQLKQTERLSNQLRFKIHQSKNKHGRYFYYWTIAHLPHRLPEVLVSLLPEPDQKWVREQELEIWRAIHRILDGNGKTRRF